jgi:hypothetical protein
MSSEYSVFELRDSEAEMVEQPTEGPLTNHIGTVEAETLDEAYARALSEFGSPIAVE